MTRSGVLLVAGLALMAAALAGCGESPQAPPDAPPQDAEQAFLKAMVPHHVSAVEMAEVARDRARSAEIRTLSGRIVAAQEREIEQMQRIHERLYRGGLVPDDGAHDLLGLSAQEAGMDHMDSSAKLERAKPFDRAFVDHMVPHHEGAVRMAEAVLPRTQDPELRALARSIIRDQEREIAEMNEFRTAEYGAPVPAADAPGDSGGHGAEHG